MKKIALINITPNCIEPMLNTVKKFETIKPVQYMDSTILDEIRSEGHITDRCMGRMLSMIADACQDGAEGIVLTCTMFSKYVETFRKLFSVPIIGADVAMMEQAGKIGGKYALLCTFRGTKEPSEKLLKKYCEMSEKEFSIDTYVLEDAYSEAQTGNLKKHNEIIKNKIEEFDKKYDNIVLAQMSMADAANLANVTNTKVYTSPQSALETIQDITEQSTSGTIPEKTSGITTTRLASESLRDIPSKSILGCIADDFTGASDAASFLAKQGVKTVLYNGIPEKSSEKTSKRISEKFAGKKGELADVQAIVIALKTRTMETKKAVAQSLEAVEWLKEHGAGQIYVKYCSTFDSTKEGNIGPIMDALLEKYQVPYSILCPALPVNGRTVENGKLYVNGVPLDESPMKNHPLTPMWDSEIKNLMEAQSKYSCLNVYDIGEKEQNKVQEYSKKENHFYVIPDYKETEDAKKIVEVFGDLPILSGGSGLLEELAFKYASTSASETNPQKTKGKALLLAGSCSVATRGQIAYMKQKGIPMKKMDPLKLLNGTQTEEELWNFIESNDSEVLIYSSDNPENVKEVQKAGKEEAAQILERTTANLAKRAVENGITRIIVAGGETSGAVTKALGYYSYGIGESVAPGVPIMIPKENENIRLVLKSGNFGNEDFMEKALKMTGEYQK